MGIPICKNSNAAISLVTHCRVMPDVLSLLRIDRKGRCFGRLEVAGIAVGTVAAITKACAGAARAVPNVTALFVLDVTIGDKEGSRMFLVEEEPPPVIGIDAFGSGFRDVDIDCWESDGLVIVVGRLNDLRRFPCN